MKNLLKASLVLLLLIGIGVSCNETMLENETALEKANLTDTEINNLVKDYNKSLFEKFGVNTPSIQKGKVYNGFLESNTLEEAEGLFLAFLLTEIDKNGNETKITRFDFGLDNKIDFPNEIKNANVIFIGNQLIINDIDKNTWINLFVQNDDETKNITPSIETINGRYLGIEKVSNIANAQLAGCDCKCETCIHAEVECFDESCSCTCNGYSCSKSCRKGANAVCGSCDSGDQ